MQDVKEFLFYSFGEAALCEQSGSHFGKNKGGEWNLCPL